MNFSLPPVVKNLLIINIGIFIIAVFVGLNYNFDVNNIFGLYSPYSEKFRAWQFVTYMFMHQYSNGASIYWMHILGNMFGLFMFGPMLERVWGSKRFLFFYMFTGIGAGLLYWGINTYETYELKSKYEQFVQSPSPELLTDAMKSYNKEEYELNREQLLYYRDHPGDQQFIEMAKSYLAGITAKSIGTGMVGASGAIFGILLAFAMIFPNTEFMLLFPPIPLKAKYLVAIYGLYELYSLIQHRADDNVAHFAHLAGMGFGFILIKYWGTKRDRFY